jgi:putative hydrolase of the HAD superfamily
MHDLCVVFDVDDTLYLERDYVASGFRAVGDWVARWLSIADFETRCLELHDSGHRGNIFDGVLRACDHPANPELISGLVAIYRGHRPQISMAGDAVRAIEEIRHNWPIAVITDGPVISQSQKCEALGLASIANPIILTGIRGDKFHKPQSGAFELVASQMEARRFVYVADNPVKDFTAPHQLGWQSVRIRRKGGLHYDKSNSFVQPDFEIPDCSDLSAILAKIASRDPAQ